MDNHELFELALAILNFGLGALGYVLWQNLRDVRDESKTAADHAATDVKRAADALAAHELYCARNFVTNDGLVKAISDLKSDLKESIAALVAEMKQNNENNQRNFRDVFNRLNEKQDKP